MAQSSFITMPSGRKVPVPGDVTPEEAEQIYTAELASEPADSAQPDAAAAQPSTDDVAPAAQTKPKEPEKDWVDRIPSAAGMLFSIAGGSRALPTGMGMAALGGAAGEGVRQVIRSVQGRDADVPGSDKPFMEGALERIKAMGAEGASQAAGEGIGRGLGAVVTPIAKGFYGAALSPLVENARNVGSGNLLKGLKRIVDTGFENRIMPTARGGVKAGRLVDESKAAADAIAAANPKKVDLKPVIFPAFQDQTRRMATAQKGAGITPNMKNMYEQAGNVIRSNPRKVTMKDVQALRRSAEDVADPVFKAARAPGGPGYVAPGSEASVARSLADAYKKTLDQELGGRFAAVNARTQDLMGAKRAAEYASSRPHRLSNILSVAGGVASGDDPSSMAQNAILTRAILDPRSIAGAALMAPGVAKYGLRGLDLAGGGTMDESLKAAILRALEGGGEEP